MKELLKKEPALILLAIRIILLVVSALGFAQFSDADMEQILTVVGLMLGIDAVGTTMTRSRVYSPASAEKLVANSLTPLEIAGEVGAVAVNLVKDYVFQLIRGLVKPIQVPEALSLVTPIIQKYANETLLTVETKQKIADEVHTVLRRAGLVRKVSFGSAKSLIFIIGILALSSCAPVFNELLADDLFTVSASEEGFIVNPDGTAYDVILDIKGDNLQSLDPEDNCTLQDDGDLRCVLGNLVSPIGSKEYYILEQETLVELVGDEVSLVALFLREVNGRLYSYQF